jgi:hypothetical protein
MIPLWVAFDCESIYLKPEIEIKFERCFFCVFFVDVKKEPYAYKT